MAVNVEEDDALIAAVQIELDRVVTKEVCEAVYEVASLHPEEKTKQKLDNECKTRKNVIVEVIANSVNLERLYFIIRSAIMGGITGIFTFSIISLLAITNFLELVFLGIIAFVVALLASRVLDKSVVRFCNIVISYLKKHERVKNFILKRF
jgi:hypothetical protein